MMLQFFCQILSWPKMELDKLINTEQEKMMPCQVPFLVPQQQHVEQEWKRAHCGDSR